MRAVDVDVHRRKAILKTFRDKALCRQVVTLVELVTTDYIEDAGIALQTGAVKLNPVEQVRDPREPAFGVFQRTAAHDAVNFVIKREQVLREIAAVLAGDTCD